LSKKKLSKFQEGCKQPEKSTRTGLQRWASGERDKTHRERKIFYFQTELGGDHLTCNINQTTCGKCKLLLDTGSELSLIKISSLIDQTIIYEDIIYQLKGINNQHVATLERTQLDVQIGNKTISAEFQIVHSAFLIPNDGILGRLIMIKNEIIMNYQKHKVIITDESDRLRTSNGNANRS